jgi:hypothetical protein
MRSTVINHLGLRSTQTNVAGISVSILNSNRRFVAVDRAAEMRCGANSRVVQFGFADLASAPGDASSLIEGEPLQHRSELWLAR